MKKLLVSLLLVCAPVLSFAQSMGTFAIEAKPADQYLSYNFGSVTVGFTMYADITLTAKATETLEVKKITISGFSYDASSNCPAVLNPGQTCTTRVYFLPHFEGGHWGQLAFQLKENNIFVDLFGYAWKR